MNYQPASLRVRVTWLLGALLALTAPCAAAELIPAARLTSWTPGVNVGVPGGIPQRQNLVDVTKAPYNADRTGVADCSDAITAAIRAASAGDVIYLPAGKYRVAKPITVFNKSDFSIRGDGDATTLMSYCGYPGVFYFGSSTDYLWNYPSSEGVAITGGLNRGSTTLTVADTSLFSVGQLIQIKENDDIALPVVNLGARTGSHGATQKAIVVGKTATTLTISPGLYWGLNSGLKPKVYPSRGQAQGIGIENLKIDGTNSTSSYVIWLEQCVNSWINNVHIASAYQYMVFLMDCIGVEIRRTNFNASSHTGSNGAGLLVEGTCASLFEDNIFYKIFPHLEMNFGSCGNVFAYNFCEDSSVYGMIGVSIDANHGPHNRLNLYEGNISPLFQSDGYFGSASEDTVFRNWLHGTSPGVTGVREPVILNRFTRNYSVIGNLLGRPGLNFSQFYLLGTPLMGNNSYSGTAQLSAGRPWADWAAYLDRTLTKGTNDGFLEMDLDVAATTIRKGNYNTNQGGIPAAEALDGQTLPASLYRSAKPAWFGQLAWPPFDPLSPNLKYDAIPAGYRYLHGIDPGVDKPSQPPIGVRVQVATQ